MGNVANVKSHGKTEAFSKVEALVMGNRSLISALSYGLVGVAICFIYLPLGSSGSLAGELFGTRLS
jgi:uncharacterized membrane protein YuzA (DUF378 family)